MGKNRAQVFASDFIFSVGVFLIVIASFSLLWEQAQSTIQRSREKDSLSVLAYAASDALVLSPGFPDDWTSLNVSSIGLAKEPRVIDALKFLELRKIDYGTGRFVLGFGGNDFRLSVTNNGSLLRSGLTCVQRPVAYFADLDTDFFRVLNNSGAVWDFYCVKSSKCDFLKGDFRNKYNSSGSQQATLDALLNNQNLYGMIIIESYVQPVNPLDKETVDLIYFFNHSGILVYEGDAHGKSPLLANFNMSFVFNPRRTCGGEVTFLGSLLHGVKIGYSVDFFSCNLVFYNETDDSPLKIYVKEKTVQGGNDAPTAFVGSWNYSAGTIYYIADVNSTFYYSEAGGSQKIPGTDVYNVVGQPLEYGASIPTSAWNVFVSRRPVAVDLGSDAREKCYGSLDLVVWRNW